MQRAAAVPLKLDRNESPLGPSPLAVRLIRTYATSVHRYPSALYDECRRAVAQYLGHAPSEVLLTSGVDEAVDLFMSLTGSVVLFRPGFPGFADRARIWGRRVEWRQLTASWKLPPLSVNAADGAIVASPHNPSGTLYGVDDLARLTGAVRWTLWDETYIDFSDAPSILNTHPPEGVIVFRSFSKSHGLAGIRIGCLIGSRGVIRELARRKAFYTVDTIALAGLIGVLRDPNYVRRCVATVRAERQWVGDRLAQIPSVCTWPSAANFVLLGVSNRTRARRLRRGLELARISVRECSDLGLPDHFRVSIGRRRENERFISVLRRILGDE